MIVNRQFRQIGGSCVALLVVTSVGCGRETLTSADVRRFGNAVARGLEYLADPKTEAHPLQLLALDYLQERFGLEPRFRLDERSLKFKFKADEETFRAYRRLMDPTDPFIPDLTPFARERMMRLALHCDKLDATAVAELEPLVVRLSQGTPYEVTHAAVALRLSSNNGCTLPTLGSPESRRAFAVRLVGLMKDRSSIPDLRYEAMVAASLLGFSDLVPERLYLQLLNEQQADGGWRATNLTRASSDHATMLAVWALLEKTDPRKGG